MSQRAFCQKRHNLLAPQVRGVVRPLKAFQSFLLQAQPLLSPSALALGCLVALDMVVRQEDIVLAYPALQRVHRFRDKPSIRWRTEDPTETATEPVTNDPTPEGSKRSSESSLQQAQYDERTISSFTWIAVNEVVAWQTLEQSMEELVRVLGSQPYRMDLPRDWQGLLDSAAVHAAAHLSSAVRTHVLGQTRMAALDPSAAAREGTKRALDLSGVAEDVEEATAGSEASLRKARTRPSSAFGVGISSKRREADLVNDIARACNAGNGLNPSAARSAVLQALAGVHLRMADDHCWPRILLLVAISLVQESRLAMASVGRYSSGGASRLYAALSDIDVGTIKADDLVAKIKAAEMQAEDSNMASVRIVGQAVLDLLVRQDLIDPVRLGRVQGSKARISVRAQVVWPHEVTLMLDWLDSAICAKTSGPVLPMVRCLLGVGNDTGMRIGEVLCIRLSQLCFLKNRLQITYAPTRADPTPKSKEARRIVFVDDPRVIRFVVDYLKERHAIHRPPNSGSPPGSTSCPLGLNQQLAQSDALFFGDPHAEGEIWHEAEVRKWLSLGLKNATGDGCSVPHDLRHSWTSFGNEVDFCQFEKAQVSPFDQRANELGHAPSDMMFTSYTHLFGAGIRHGLDRQLFTDCLLTTRTVAAWTATSNSSMTKQLESLQTKTDANLRARLSRFNLNVRSETGQRALMEFVDAFASKTEAPTADIVFGIAMRDAASPLVNYRPKSLSLEVLLRCLGMLTTDGQDAQRRAQAIAYRAGINADEWKFALDEFLCVNRTAADVAQPSVVESSPHVWLVKNHWGRAIDDGLHQRWRQLVRYLDRHSNDDDVAWASEYVIRLMGGRKYLPVEAADSRFMALLRVIKGSGINLASLVLQCNSLNPTEQHRAQHAHAKIKGAMGAAVCLEMRNPRGGRPPLYLSIRSRPAQIQVDADQDGGARSMKGFAALFLGAHIKHSLMKREQRVESEK